MREEGGKDFTNPVSGRRKMIIRALHAGRRKRKGRGSQRWRASCVLGKEALSAKREGRSVEMEKREDNGATEVSVVEDQQIRRRTRRFFSKERKEGGCSEAQYRFEKVIIQLEREKERIFFIITERGRRGYNEQGGRLAR